jgi:hypothetical protein
MVIFGETRAFHPVGPRVPGMLRVATIGDSLTYGAAVTPDETLESHLEIALNAAFPALFVETVNLGRNGSNFWHAWSTFEHHFAERGFDAVILSICSNDTELFDGYGVRYERSPWVGSFQLSYMEQTLRRIQEFAQTNSIFVVLNYYSFIAADRERIAAVGAMCDRLGFPFVDMRTYLVEVSGGSSAKYVASPLDGHPSGRAHELAARRIVDEFVRLKPFPEGGGSVDIAAEAWRLAHAMRSHGRDADECLRWAGRVLQAKARVWRRMLNKPQGVQLGAVEDRERDLQAAYAAWRSVLALWAWFEGLPAVDRDKFWHNMLNYSARLRDFDELVHCLGNIESDDQAATLSDLLRSSEPHRDRAAEPPEMTESEASELLARASSLVDSLAVLARAEFAAPHGLPPAVETFAELSRQLIADTGRFVALTNQHSPGDVQARAFLLQVAAWQLRQTRSWYNHFERLLADAARRVSGETVFFTRIDVVVECPDGTDDDAPRTFLYARASYRQPLRRRYVERQLCGFEKKRWVYRFELPLMILGDVEVAVPPDAPAYDRFTSGRIFISEVRVFNAAAPAAVVAGAGVVWRNEAREARPSILLSDAQP